MNNNIEPTIRDILNQEYIKDIKSTDSVKECNKQAITYAEEGKFDEAIELLNQAIKQSKDTLDLYYNRSICKFRSALIDYIRSIGFEENPTITKDLTEFASRCDKAASAIKIFISKTV